jgi:hypothetical protein
MRCLTWCLASSHSALTLLVEDEDADGLPAPPPPPKGLPIPLSVSVSRLLRQCCVKGDKCGI